MLKKKNKRAVKKEDDGKCAKGIKGFGLSKVS